MDIKDEIIKVLNKLNDLKDRKIEILEKEIEVRNDQIKLLENLLELDVVLPLAIRGEITQDNFKEIISELEELENKWKILH